MNSTINIYTRNAIIQRKQYNNDNNIRKMVYNT